MHCAWGFCCASLFLVKEKVSENADPKKGQVKRPVRVNRSEKGGCQVNYLAFIMKKLYKKL